MAEVLANEASNARVPLVQAEVVATSPSEIRVSLTMAEVLCTVQNRVAGWVSVMP